MSKYVERFHLQHMRKPIRINLQSIKIVTIGQKVTREDAKCKSLAVFCI